MSDANRKQNQELVESIWQNICQEVGADRGIDPNRLKQYAKDLTIATVEDALEAGMVDMVAYEDTLYDIYKEYGNNIIKNGNTVFGRLSSTIGC